MAISGTDLASPEPGVTVVVPVYNPSHYIERTIASLLDQTMPRTRYEVVFVDDGSDHGTPARLDELAAEHPDLIRVVHQPNSGGPGGPRNLGLELARYEYVFYCDADDWLPRPALQTMVNRAVLDGSDVVIAKSLGNRRSVALALFEGGDFCTTLAETPGVFTTLTCQKLFRREHLRETGTRFPEGRVRIEDFIFMTEVYLRAGRISIHSSSPCYVFEAREDAGNITASPAPPLDRLESVAKVLDVIDAFAADSAARDAATSRIVQSGMMRVVAVPRFLQRPEAEREAVFSTVSQLLRTRVPESVIAQMGVRSQRLARAVINGDRAFVEHWVAWESGLRANARATEVTVVDSRLYLDFEVELTHNGQPARVDNVDGRMVVRSSVDSDTYDVTTDVHMSTVHVALRSTRTTENWRVRGHLQAQPGADPGAVELRWRARAVIDVATAGGGRPLAGGMWTLRAHLVCLGPNRVTPIQESGAIREQPQRRPGVAGPRPMRTDRGRLAMRVVGRRGRPERTDSWLEAQADAASIGGMSSVTEPTRQLTGWRGWAVRAARRLGLTVTELPLGELLLSRRRPPRIFTLNRATTVLARGKTAGRVRTRELAGGSWLVDAPAADERGVEVDEVAEQTWLVSAPGLSLTAEPVRETEVLRALGAKHVNWLLERYEIDCVLDVGANKGQYASAIRQGGYTGHIVSFEPVPQFASRLMKLAKRDDTWAVRNVALGRTEGTVPIHVQRSFSSLLPASDYGKGRFTTLREFADAETVDVAVQRLDAIFDDVLAPLIASGITRPRILLKMDTQGFDLEAFAGLGERVGDILVLQSEVALLPIYEQMPRMADALAVYEAAGFELTGLYPVTRERDGRIIEYDCTMVRPGAVPNPVPDPAAD